MNSYCPVNLMARDLMCTLDICLISTPEGIEVCQLRDLALNLVKCNPSTVVCLWVEIVNFCSCKQPSRRSVHKCDFAIRTFHADWQFTLHSTQFWSTRGRLWTTVVMWDKGHYWQWPHFIGLKPEAFSQFLWYLHRATCLMFTDQLHTYHFQKTKVHSGKILGHLLGNVHTCTTGNPKSKAQ